DSVHQLMLSDNGLELQWNKKDSVLFAVDNTGKVTINDGTQANGYVLTSDANGKASWQPGAAGSLPVYDDNAAAVAVLGTGKYFVTSGGGSLPQGIVCITY
ncbi:MAG TPA: hypothetical protein VG603_11375, partial [Chitinophagales bacterium]|nr:hypothetical protein [Chitinophagales bacterium]